MTQIILSFKKANFKLSISKQIEEAKWKALEIN
jgi:hypothetical protein